MTEIAADLEGEVLRRDCFLCRPNARLLVDVSAGGYAIAGLGPLTDGYTVVATHEHLKGLVAADREQRLAFSVYASRIAAGLAKEYGACFIMEHGNMALCGIEAADRAHCYHPHLLMLPSASCNIDPFNDFFDGTSTTFESLSQALEYGTQCGQYILAGHFPGPFAVFSPGGDLPRQFARGLAAEQLGQSSLASWRNAPNIDWAIRNASKGRKVVE